MRTGFTDVRVKSPSGQHWCSAGGNRNGAISESILDSGISPRCQPCYPLRLTDQAWSLSHSAYSAASSADIAIPWANAASHTASPSWTRVVTMLRSYHRRASGGASAPILVRRTSSM